LEVGTAAKVNYYRNTTVLSGRKGNEREIRVVIKQCSRFVTFLCIAILDSLGELKLFGPLLVIPLRCPELTASLYNDRVIRFVPEKGRIKTRPAIH
jgi:hypothetical protein